MKVRWLIVLFPCLAPVIAGDARAERLDIQLSVPAPRSHQDDSGYSHVRIDGYLNRGRPGAPSLPGKVVPVLLPPGHEAVSVEVHAGELLPMEGTHLVFPVQRQYPPSHTGPRVFTEPDASIFAASAAYPPRLGEARDLQSKRGFAVLPVVVSPVVYAPASGRLAWAPAIEISVVTRPRQDAPAGREPRAVFRGLERDFQAVESLVANPSGLKDYPLRIRAPRGTGHRYVVVTSAELAACEGDHTLQTLVAEKNQRGITTRIATMEEIVSGYEGVDDAERVRNFIRDMYENQGTDYVLLAGDADLEVVGGETEPVIVPVRGLWGNIEYGMDENNLPSDLYYACLDGTFNADLDGVWGEETDGVDLLAEVLVGRVPVDSCTEVANFVRKTLAYRANRDSYLRNVWLAGEWLAPDVYAADYLDPLYTGTWMYGHFTRGFIENPFFEVQALYDRGVCEQECWGPEEILGVMNGGIHILHHCGHSYTNYNMRVTCDDIDAGLDNTEYFFQYTGGCYPGAFDNRTDPVGGNNEVLPQDSFVEHLLLGEHGAFASIMFTRYGVGEILPKYFWDAAFGRGMKNLAAMHTYSRELASGMIDDRYIRWQVYSLNLFGDPELSLHMSDSTEPLLGVPRTPLWFLAARGGDNPSPQVFVVRNDGEGELDFTASSDQAWLSVSPGAGTAPREVALSVDTAGLPTGQHPAELTVTAPGVGNSPQTVEVWLYLDDVPSMGAPHTLVSPVVDGTISEDEYEGAGFMDVGIVAAGLSTAHVLHDGEKLYLAFVLGDDPDADDYDTLNIYFDTNNDDHYPPVPGDDGLYYLEGSGAAYFIPTFDAGNGTEYGDFEEDPAGVEVAFAMSRGTRVVEVAFDLSEGHLQAQVGSSIGMGLLYWDHAGNDWAFVGGWPGLVMSMGGEEPAFLGNLELEREADRVWILPESLRFQAVAGGEPSGSATVTIEASTENQQDFSLLLSDPWIRVSAESGTTPVSIEVWADPSGLGAGTFEGQITVLAPGAKNSPITLSVALEVAEPAPVMSVEPRALDFQMTEGDALPDPREIVIRNLGGGEIVFTAIPSGDWFDLSALTGTAPATLTVSPTDGELSAGTYAGVILVTAPDLDPVQVEVRLVVEARQGTGDGGPDPQPTGTAGCGCSTPAPVQGTPPLLGLLVGLVALVRRRRARQQGPQA